MIQYQVKDKFHAPALEKISVGGSISQQMETFFEKRVVSDFAKNVIYKETEDAFRLQEDDITVAGYWRGEFWGKWMISACRVCRYKKDEKLKAFLRKAAHQLISLQREDGYIGTYKVSENVLIPTPEQTQGIHPRMNWNIWCRKYTLWGLVEAYMLTEDSKILDATVRFASHLIDELARLGYRLCDVGTFNGLASGSILKPMLILYRITGDKKYLDFCLENVADWDREDGKIPNLIKNSLSGTPVYEWYPFEKYGEWAKAYEMMSSFDGLCELYRITGTEKYLDAIKAFYQLLYQYDYNVLFSVGFNDQFKNGANVLNTGTEPCDVIHWMRLCFELFKLTGDIQYMNTFELAYYNPLLASAFKNGEWGPRMVRSSGFSWDAHQCNMKYSHCCVNNMPRGLLNAVEAQVMYTDDRVLVNMYNEYSGEVQAPFGDVKVEITGNLFSDSRVSVAVDASAATKLALRIPAWSLHTVITLNGKNIEPKANTYYVLDIPAGQTVLNIAFEMKVTIEDFPYEFVQYPDTDKRVLRWRKNQNSNAEDVARANVRKSRVLYGPLLLTRSKLCGNTEEEMFSDDTVCGRNFTVKLTEIPADEGIRIKFKAEFTNGSESFETVMCDFGSGTNVLSEDLKLFSIYV